MWIDVPAWWTEELQEICEDAADRAFPNEAFAFLCEHATGGTPYLSTLPVRAWQTGFQALPDATIGFAYSLLDSGHRILATFHSHPQGQSHWSVRDSQLLAAWTPIHVLAARTPQQWMFRFVHSSITHSPTD